MLRRRNEDLDEKGLRPLPRLDMPLPSIGRNEDLDEKGLRRPSFLSDLLKLIRKE